MKYLLLIILVLPQLSIANCRGCCSRHKGVVCSSNITQCRDGSDLSSKCKAKGCNKCGVGIKPAPINQSVSYNRKLYPHWIDEDRDCQNTRAEILIENNRGNLKFKRNKACNVSWGKWFDPYSGKVFTKASDLDIDHIVPLKHAHDNGAANWTREMRRNFANDPLNLIAVDKKLNRQKGYKGPIKWKPPRREFYCEYAKRWKAIKRKYSLSSSKREVASVGVLEQKCQ